MAIYTDESGGRHERPADRDVVWRISGYPLVQRDDGRILMVQPTWNTLWELPGGGIEVGETIQEGIIRECWEETGYRIMINAQPTHVSENNFYSKALDIYFHSVILIYVGYLAHGIQHKEVINTVEKDEIAKVEWVSLNTLDEQNVHLIVWPAIQRLTKERRGDKR